MKKHLYLNSIIIYIIELKIININQFLQMKFIVIFIDIVIIMIKGIFLIIFLISEIIACPLDERCLACSSQLINRNNIRICKSCNNVFCSCCCKTEWICPKISTEYVYICDICLENYFSTIFYSPNSVINTVYEPKESNTSKTTRQILFGRTPFGFSIRLSPEGEVFVSSFKTSRSYLVSDALSTNLIQIGDKLIKINDEKVDPNSLIKQVYNQKNPVKLDFELMNNPKYNYFNLDQLF